MTTDWLKNKNRRRRIEEDQQNQYPPVGNGEANEYVLGRHLLPCHGLRSNTSFDDYYVFSIIEHCSPLNIDKNEHKWIHRLKCLKPFGLNSHDPYGIPLVL